MYQLLDKADSSTFKRPSKLNVLIADASGSMSWAMKQLALDTIDRVNALPAGDAVLIGLFSGEGWFRWIASRELSTADDYSVVAKLIGEQFFTRGTTCFSEIMADTPQAIKPFLTKFPVVTLNFMSDGHPVVSNPAKEEEMLLKACGELKNFITAGAIIAYGDYANRPLLTKVAKELGVEFVSTADIKGVGDTFARISDSKASRKKRVSVPKGSKVAFAVEEDHSVTSLAEGECYVPESATVWSLDDLNSAGSVEDLGYYAALALLSDNKVDEATDMLSRLGDVHFVKALGNAITNAELTKVEEQIKAALADPKLRFTEGKSVGCVPAEDAFDLISLIEILQGDDDAAFFPYHPDFQYKRIGRKTTPKEGYPTFAADKAIAVKISDLVGHSSELNLSIKAFIPGTIELPDEVDLGDSKLTRAEVGLDKEYKCHVYRNYSLISNGLPQTTRLPITTSAQTFDLLRSIAPSLIAGFTSAVHDTVQYTLDLTAIPACNKARGKAACEWEEYARLATESLKIGCVLKVLKAKKNELDPDKEFSRPTNLTEDQSNFLRACGVRDDNTFSPPVEQEEATDVLPIRLFEVKVAKSSAVTVANFIAKLKSGKPLNMVEGLMKLGQDEIDQDLPAQKGPALEWLDARIKSLTKDKRTIDNGMTFMKYTVALGGHWSRHNKTDERVIKYGDTEVTLLFKQTTKAI